VATMASQTSSVCIPAPMTLAWSCTLSTYWRSTTRDRRAKLCTLLARPDGIRFSEGLAGDGEKIFRHGCKLGLEGMGSKLRDSAYRSGRCTIWRKIKNPESPAMQRLETDA
jgi:ATP-dependent DNA ligase